MDTQELSGAHTPTTEDLGSVRAVARRALSSLTLAVLL